MPRQETAEIKRQMALARWIGVEFHETDKLIPLQPHSRMWVPPLPANDMWLGQLSTERVDKLAWAAVAAQLSAPNPINHIIDHAWLFGFSEGEQEPWGFVAEPYLDAKAIDAHLYLARDAMAEWEVKIQDLNPAQSSWNPGNCTPIVATFVPGMMPRLIRRALCWALAEPAE